LTVIDPETIWAELRREHAPNAPGSIRRRVTASAPCDIYLAVEVPSRHPMLVLSLPGNATDDLEVGTWSAGVETGLLPNSGGMTDLWMKLSDDRYADLFARLVLDLIDTVLSEQQAEGAIRRFSERFRRWQTLLQRSTQSGLGQAAQVGLYGELWFMMRYLVDHLPSRAIVDAWVGPLGANQDFQLPGLAVEVKCTGTKRPLRVRVHSERQLDDTGVLDLFLCALVFDVRQSDRATLPQLVANVRRAVEVDQTALVRFDERLLLMGYLDSHSSHYSERSFSLREEHLYRATSGFPRIVEQDLRNGVGDVSYSVGLGECAAFEVDRSVVTAAIEAGHNDV
jgi:hypothetical protein